MFNVGVFLALSVIAAGEVSMGVGFGLFAVLSIVRLRSEPFSNRELAYFFVALVLALVCALDIGARRLRGPALAAVALLAAWAIDHPRLGARRPERRCSSSSSSTRRAAPPPRGAARRDGHRRPVLEIDYVRETTRAARCVPTGPRRWSRRPRCRVARCVAEAFGADRARAARRRGRPAATAWSVKYVVPLATFAELAERLLPTHVALEIDGRRAFAYRSTYFDTPELLARSATTSSSAGGATSAARASTATAAPAMFEVKLKGPRGRTVKHRMAHDGHELSDAAVAFLRDCLDRAYGFAPGGGLRPALEVAYTRVTLAAPALAERVTCDFDLTFAAPDGAVGRLDPGMAIVESKSVGGAALADRVLRELGRRPQEACSKYCLGVALTRPVAGNPLLPLLRRHFRAGAVTG